MSSATGAGSGVAGRSSNRPVERRAKTGEATADPPADRDDGQHDGDGDDAEKDGIFNHGGAGFVVAECLEKLRHLNEPLFTQYPDRGAFKLIPRSR